MTVAPNEAAEAKHKTSEERGAAHRHALRDACILQNEYLNLRARVRP